MKQGPERRSFDSPYDLAGSSAAPEAARIRMTPQDRERFILDRAIQFFAEQGLDGNTRDLARSLGITQSLIYRYFPNKDALIEAVYQTGLEECWNPEWANWIKDRSQPLSVRVLRFYRDYSQALMSFRWVRLFAFSGLKGLDYHQRFMEKLRELVFLGIASEMRFDYGLPSPRELPITEFELELIVALHAAVFYISARRWLYNLPGPRDVDSVLAARVAGFVCAAPPQIAAHLASLPMLKMASD